MTEAHHDGSDTAEPDPKIGPIVVKAPISWLIGESPHADQVVEEVVEQPKVVAEVGNTEGYITEGRNMGQLISGADSDKAAQGTPPPQFDHLGGVLPPEPTDVHGF